MKKKPDWEWPDGKRIAVVFNVCLEAWSDGKAPGISPMGNPLPAGVLDTMAISWAAYGVEVGIHRLMDGFARHGAVVGRIGLAGFLPRFHPLHQVVVLILQGMG